MEVFRGHANVPPGFGPSAVTIGNFDGVHRGHQALLQHSKRAGKTTVVYTFEPHPVRVLNPTLAPPRITPEREKLRLLGELGVDACIVEPFTRELAALDPDAWVRTAIVDALHAEEVTVGYDFTYGKGGKGNALTLQQYPFALNVISAQSFNGIVASSTKVREFVLEGRMDGARLLLGRDYSIEGTVVHGHARGRSIGFPTANIETDYELMPRYGVYACRAGAYKAVANVGLRPTVNETDSKPLIEAHLFDFSGDLYGQSLRLDFVARIRDEQRFKSLDALTAQIAIDAQTARTLLA